MSTPTADFLPPPFLPRSIATVPRPDGALLMHSQLSLGPAEPHLSGVLRRHAARQPQRPWLMQRRGPQGAWQALHYGDASAQADAVAQWLLSLGRPGRAVVVLSGNSLEHAVVEMGAMLARMPYAPLTPAYSLLASDFSRLRTMVGLIDPVVVFVQSQGAFAPALQALALPADCRVVFVDDPVPGGPGTAWSELLHTPVTPQVDASLAQVNHDTVAKVLFTSGSTGVPKAVPLTQRMLCATMAMHARNVQRGPDEPPSLLLEWLPWSHVAGGTAIFNSVLEDGGTLYLDDGRPAPGEFDKTLRNLRELSPTRFSSVPIGYAMLADALEQDEALGRSFFHRLRRLTSSGARLPDSIQQRLQTQAIRHTGHRMPFVSSYGSTETCAGTTTVHWPTERAGLVGLPQPGVALKLVPLDDDRWEVRVKGPSVMAGYLHQPEASAQAFDDEGWYCMGDAVRFVDPQRPEEGLAFAGRVAEEFKLLSGIFVRVGTLRVELVNAAAPWLADAVITGADRAYVGALAWLDARHCRAALGGGSPADWVADPRVRQAVRDAVQAHNGRHAASSQRVQRVLLMAEPASMDAGEINDKGYVNQRAVLARRAAAVEALYADPPGPDVLCMDAPPPAR